MKTKRAATSRKPRRPSPRRIGRARGVAVAKPVFFFGGGKADGRADMKNLLGGKGANLAEMAGLGLPVPPGFTITTEVCTYYYANGNRYPRGLEEAAERNLRRMEKIVGAAFGDPENPLLVSIRSG